MRKYNHYLELDPELKHQPKGYEHIKAYANALRTKDFTGINFI